MVLILSMDWNTLMVTYKGDYISRFSLNDSTTYLKHSDEFSKEDIDVISVLCEHYTKQFTEANDYLKSVVDDALIAKGKNN